MLHAGDNIVEGIPVEVIRKRIRRINLRVTPEGTVRLSIPAYWATLREGEAFLRSKLDWVRKTRSAILARPAPSRAPESEAELESLRALLGELNASWTARLRLEPFEWKLRKVKTFWGCCNWRRRLVTYNVELARAPRELVEYVVVHELTHFDAHDHGPKFPRRVFLRVIAGRRFSPLKIYRKYPLIVVAIHPRCTASCVPLRDHGGLAEMERDTDDERGTELGRQDRLGPLRSACGESVGRAPHVIRFDRPAEDSLVGWERWSLPIGCGHFGVSVFGIPDDERLAGGDLLAVRTISPVLVVPTGNASGESPRRLECL